MTKRTLWLGASSFYSIMVAFGPTLLGEAGLEVACGSGGSQHASCASGWTFADDACFKLFGDGVLVGEPPLSWADAEEACQEMGSQTHLASVTSAKKQAAVAHLVLTGATTGAVWIGLNDMAEEGSFVWSDDEPLEYSNFALGNPDNRDDGGGKDTANGPNGGPNDAFKMGGHGQADGLWRDVHTGKVFPYVCARKATPTTASGGEMNGCT
eukprot:SAG22_NODE_7406_length_742_cov_36.537455_1_plen_210_part_10